MNYLKIPGLLYSLRVMLNPLFIYLSVMTTKKNLLMLSIPCLLGCTNLDPLFEEAIPQENKLYDSRIIEGLPEPVQRYFRYALVDGQAYINFLRLKHSGTFKTARDRKWMEIQGEQYFRANPPGFLWIGKTGTFKAEDSYLEGEGNLSVYLFGLLRIVKEEGNEVNQAELLRWLGESVWMPTNFLPDENRSWTAIDENTARLNFTYQGTSVYYIVTFDDNGPIISLETERYMGDSLVAWRGEVGNYCCRKGMMVPAHIEASWILEDGPYTYARFQVNEFEYDKAETY